MKSEHPINTLQILIYQIINWQFVIWMYSVFVSAGAGAYIGLAIFFGLYTNALSFAISAVVNKFILSPRIKSGFLYYLLLILLVFTANQLSFLGVKDTLPVFDLQQAGDFYKGENMLFTVSPFICSSIVFGLFYLRNKSRNAKTSH